MSDRYEHIASTFEFAASTKWAGDEVSKMCGKDADAILDGLRRTDAKRIAKDKATSAKITKLEDALEAMLALHAFEHAGDDAISLNARAALAPSTPEEHEP